MIVTQTERDLYLKKIEELQSTLNENTKVGMNRLIDRFICKYGGKFPSTPDDVNIFLLRVSEGGARITTLKTYASLLVSWHRQHGHEHLADAIAREAGRTLKGLAKGRVEPPKSARPLFLDEFERIDSNLSSLLASSTEPSVRARALRDQTLLRLLFFSGCRESEICSLTTLTCKLKRRGNDKWVELYWQESKGDRNAIGTFHRIPALPNSDPWSSLEDYMECFKIEDGPIFRAVDRWGNISKKGKGLNPNSIPRWLRQLAMDAGIDEAGFSGHSFRMGLAGLLGQTCTIPELMVYFRWKDPKTAARYVMGYGQGRVNEMLIAASNLVLNTTQKRLKT